MPELIPSLHPTFHQLLLLSNLRKGPYGAEMLTKKSRRFGSTAWKSISCSFLKHQSEHVYIHISCIYEWQITEYSSVTHPPSLSQLSLSVSVCLLCLCKTPVLLLHPVLSVPSWWMLARQMNSWILRANAVIAGNSHSFCKFLVLFIMRNKILQTLGASLSSNSVLTLVFLKCLHLRATC